MNRNETKASARGSVLLLLVFVNAIILEKAFVNNEEWYWMLVASVPALLTAVGDFYDGV
jgi:hypothetical protein